MPIYAYKCEHCGQQHEKLQKFNDPAPACPSCGKDDQQVKQLSANTGFCLMGYGWTKNGMNAPKGK